MSGSRIKSLDSLKGLAILGVVFLHSIRPENLSHLSLAVQITNQACRFAVPCFFLTAGFFFKRSWHQDTDPLELTRRFAVRIAKPFLFWAIFYALVPPFIGGRGSEGIWVMMSKHLASILKYPHAFLLTGFTYHLWFLSSLLQAAAIVWVALRMKKLQAGLLLGVGFYVISLLGGSYAQSPPGFTTSFDMKSGPFVSTLFFAIGAWLAGWEGKPRLVWGLILFSFGLMMHLFEAFYLSSALSLPLTSHQYLLGTVPFATGAMIIALSRPNFGGVIAELGIYSLGLFVLHPYIIEVILRLPFGRELSALPVLLAVLTVAITYGLVRFLSQIQFVRPILL